jgi:hypothetical protein
MKVMAPENFFSCRQSVVGWRTREGVGRCKKVGTPEAVSSLNLNNPVSESDCNIKVSDKIESKQPIHFGLGWEVVTEHLQVVNTSTPLLVTTLMMPASGFGSLPMRAAPAREAGYRTPQYRKLVLRFWKCHPQRLLSAQSKTLGD